MKIKHYKSVLWELLPRSGGKSSYLFGTIHLPEKSLFGRLEEITELINSCDAFMSEYDLDAEDPADQFAFQLADGKGLKDLYPIKKYTRIRKQLLKSFGIDIKNIDLLKPVIIEQIIAEAMVENHSGRPMDVILWDHAKEKNKIMLGAESYISQLRIMNDLSIDLQLKNLAGIAGNPSRYRKQVKRLKRFYIDEDIRMLYKTSAKSLSNMKAMMIYKRNQIISESILNTLNEHSLFCAVGAGHLYGEHGLLRHLKRANIKVRPLYKLVQPS